MGILGQILTFPLAPARAAGWAMEQVLRAAEEELHDPARIRAELRQLEQELVRGDIDEEEFDRREDELLDRLDEAEEYRRSLRGEA